MICRNRRHLLQTKEDDIYDDARERYLRKRLHDELIAEEAEPIIPSLTKTPLKPPDSSQLRSDIIQPKVRAPKMIHMSQNKSEVISQEHGSENKLLVKTRAGRISKTPAKFKDYVK